MKIVVASLGLALVLGACRRESPPQPLTPDLDDAAVRAKSRALLEAYDRLDDKTFEAQLARPFVLFEARRIFDREALSKRMARLRERHARPPTRTWREENVHLGAGAAVYIVDSIEHFSADGDAHPAHDYDGWNTLVWAKEGNEWKLASWQIANGGVAADREEWNETYRTAPTFNVKPNQLLVDTVKGKPPGAALDLMTGQGRNAVFLASQGWKTTGVDISDEGLRIAQASAASQKVKLETVNADVETWDIGKDRWDLIAMIYAGDDPQQIERAKLGLKSGGLFVLETFHKEGEKAPGVGGFVAGQLAARFKDGFAIVRDEVVEDVADWGNKTKLVRFVAQKQ
jgi:2-polyprenyl-3-methyl-5-hydroxy-6-metoxy-1,4-benzoquinol methylase